MSPLLYFLLSHLTNTFHMQYNPSLCSITQSQVITEHRFHYGKVFHGKKDSALPNRPLSLDKFYEKVRYL